VRRVAAAVGRPARVVYEAAQSARAQPFQRFLTSFRALPFVRPSGLPMFEN